MFVWSRILFYIVEYISLNAYTIDVHEDHVFQRKKSDKILFQGHV
jgi:hypothetical protein